jgi:hypothetical protein
MNDNAENRVVPKRDLPKALELETLDIRNGNITLLDLAIRRVDVHRTRLWTWTPANNVLSSV